MSGFRRAQLRGSEELFRATGKGTGSDDDRSPDEAQSPDAGHQTELPVSTPDRRDAVAVPAPSIDGHLVRLSEPEVHALIDALQRVKFPGKAAGRPSVDEFEQLEELRQKLLSIL